MPPPKTDQAKDDVLRQRGVGEKADQKKEDDEKKNDKSPAKEEWGKISTIDLLVITVLWSYGIIFFLTESWKRSLTKNAPLAEGHITNDIHAHYSSSAALMLVIVFLTMAVASHFAGKDKYVMLLVGLHIYFLTPVFGMMLLIPQSLELVVVMICLQVGWYVVTPIRYWYIFNQAYPLSVMKTWFIVGVNECCIAVAIYVGAVWIETTLFHVIGYLFAWLASSTAMVVYIGTINFLKEKQYVNGTADDSEAVKTVYQPTEVSSSFAARQTSLHYDRFLPLIFPVFLFAAIRALNTFAVAELTSDDYYLGYYRIDLFVAMCAIPGITMCLSYRSKFRHEVRDLLAIMLAMFLSFIGLLFFMYVVLVYPKTFRMKPTIAQEIRDTPPLWGTKCGIVIFITDRESTISYTLEDTTLKSASRQLLYSSVVNITTEFPMNVYTSSSEPLGNGSVKCVPRKTTSYIFAEGEFHYVRELTQHFDQKFENLVTLVVNGFVLCPQTHSYRLGNKTLIQTIKFYDQCATVWMEFFQVLPNKTLVKYDVDLPPSYGITKPLLVLDETISFVFHLHTNTSGLFSVEAVRSRKPTTSAILHVFGINAENRGNPITHNVLSIHKALYGPRPPTLLKPECWEDVYSTKKPSFSTSKPVMPSEIPAPPSVLLCALAFCGAAVGIASVCYIHFIWIQCPIGNRLFILGLFFTFDYLGGWTIRFFMMEMNFYTVATILVFHVSFWAWHIVATLYFWRILPEITEEEAARGRHRRF